MNYFFGFSYWKHPFIEPFFDKKPIFINLLFGKNYLKKALRKGLTPKSSIYIWGKKSFPDVEHYAYTHRIPVYRVEDGFIRSIGLGSEQTQPYSLIIDRRGIYFDPNQPSDLEEILQNHQFTPQEIERAQKIRAFLVDKKISKYNLYDNVQLYLPKDRTVILVPGQVDDDASIRFGAPGMSNLKLLQQVRLNRPDAYIVYKPHPDVLKKKRIGHIDESEALKYCDQVVTKVGIDSVLSSADEVHTMTSLVGFEALLRGVQVVTYGMPFYAGWGLSQDMHFCERRTRKLSIDELSAGVYILYPTYIEPETKEQCEIEILLIYLDKNKHQPAISFLQKLRFNVMQKLKIIIKTIIN